MGNLTKHLESKAKGIDFDDDAPEQGAVARRGPRTAPGQLLDLQGRYEESQAEIGKLQKILEEGGASELPVADLHEVPGRRRNLTAEQYQELVANLRVNPLVTPVTVRWREKGGFEIISGHNRVNAYRDLGRKSISAVLVDWDEAQTELSAFYANLLQPDLPDYEKYLGFGVIVARYPELSLTEIAANAGVSTAGIYRLMSFKGLPDQALAILKMQPNLIGANAAQAFSKLCAEGKSDQVVTAIRQLASGKCTQAQAIKAASAVARVSEAKSAATTKIKAGKTTYCDVLRSEKVVRLLFSSAAEAEAAQQAIQSVLQDIANKKKAGR